MKAAALACILLAGLPDLLRAADDSIPARIDDRAPTAILRVMPSDTPPNQRLPGLSFIAGFEVLGDPVPLAPAQAARLSAAVRAPDAFSAGEPEESLRPGVAYRFGSGADAVDLLVCFSCDKVAAVRSGDSGPLRTDDLAQPTREVLLALAKELLPRDEAVQELPVIRGRHPVPPPAVPIPADAPRGGQAPAGN